MTFKEQLEKYLAPLPSEWKDKLTAILCEINSSQQTLNCEDVKDCETLTALSAFSIQGSTISIQYKDEHQVTTTRTLDLAEVINSTLEDLEPACLTDDVTWSNLTLVERIQLIIDKQCECCGQDMVIPFVNTLPEAACRYIVPSGSEDPADNDPLFQHYIKFVGQEGQGNEYIEVPLEQDETGYFIPTTGNLTLPPMSGIYTAVFYAMTGGDYPCVTFLNSGDAPIAGPLCSGNTPSLISTTFDIANLDHIEFNCSNSG